MFFSLWLYLFNHWVLNFRLDLCQRVPHSRTVWIHALDIHRDWWNFFCFFSFWTPRSWFSVESIRKPCRRIGTWATLVAGSATSRWLGSATSCATSIPTASNATRPSSPTRATIATASSVSTPRYVRHSEGSNSSLSYTIANRRRKLLVGHMSQPKTRTYYSDRLFFSSFYGALRICRTRIATGTRPVSCATSAGCRWSTSNSAPRLTRFSAARATTLCTRLGATDAAKSSAQVHSPSLYLMSYLGAYL